MTVYNSEVDDDLVFDRARAVERVVQPWAG